MQEESPEGGRFKKEIFIDNQSYLLLIRDEGGLPEMQVRIQFHIACGCASVCVCECMNDCLLSLLCVVMFA